MLVSSHVLSEMAQTVNDVVVIHRGKVVKQGPVGELTGGCPRRDDRALARGARSWPRLCARAGAQVNAFEDGALNVEGMRADAVGRRALAAGRGGAPAVRGPGLARGRVLPAHRRGVGHVRNLIRGEAIKLRSTRTAIGFTIAGVALMLLVVLVSTLADDPVDASAPSATP